MRTNIIMLVAAIGVALYANIAHLKPVSEAVSERGEASRGKTQGGKPQ